MAGAAWKWRSLGRYARLVVALLALALGLLTLDRARHDPGGSFAGVSTLGAIAELGAGWSLVAAGLLFWERRPRNLLGPLAVASGFAWFAPEWTNAGVGTALGFTAGLIGFVACAPLAGHTALSYPTGRLRSTAALATVTVAYSGALLLLGLLPATVFDPKGQACLQCPGNLALVRGDPSLYDTFNHYGLRIGIGWLAALGGLLIWRLVRSSRAAALVAAPVVGPALAYLALVGWDFQHSLGRDLLSNDGFDVRAWRYEAAALAALALGVGWGLLRERLARGSVARLVVELGRSPRPGAVREALALALGDPTLELAYRRPNADEYVDATGRGIAVEETPGRAVTPLLRGNATVAALIHDERLREDPGLVEEVVSAARLAVENEQLQAEVLAQLEDLRASRARIVETGDAERRRLERDLHDGAQQRLVALSMGLGLMRSQIGPDGAPEEARVAAAEEQLRKALEELRTLAHGIYPAVLGDEGLAAALEALGEQGEIPIRIDAVPEGRFPTAVENAGYFAVAEAVKGAAVATVSVEHEDGRLVILVRGERDGEDPEWSRRLVEITDRVGALDGRVTANGAEIRAEIPCGP
jgi:signal transduction histidine kinase